MFKYNFKRMFYSSFAAETLGGAVESVSEAELQKMHSDVLEWAEKICQGKQMKSISSGSQRYGRAGAIKVFNGFMRKNYIEVDGWPRSEDFSLFFGEGKLTYTKAIGNDGTVREGNDPDEIKRLFGIMSELLKPHLKSEIESSSRNDLDELKNTMYS